MEADKHPSLEMEVFEAEVGAATIRPEQEHDAPRGALEGARSTFYQRRWKLQRGLLSTSGASLYMLWHAGERASLQAA